MYLSESMGHGQARLRQAGPPAAGRPACGGQARLRRAGAGPDKESK